MERKSVPHVLIFPFPAQGHVNSMLILAELLCLDGLHVTFLTTENFHQNLLTFTNINSRFSPFPGFRFETMSDGLPIDNARSSAFISGLLNYIKNVVRPAFEELVNSVYLKSDDDRPPVTCIISDGVMSFTIDVAKDLGIPIISFRTVSACCLWSYLCIPKLIEAGELPLKDEADMDKPITSIPGMEGYLRRRDLPSFLRAKELDDLGLQLVLSESINSTRASAQILNSFENLEGSSLSQIRSQVPKLYTLGPLHALLSSRRRNRNSSTTPISSSNSLREIDRSCMTWLDSQPLKSVLYVSFGSITQITPDELLEFWHGLVNSGKRFLWVVRSDIIAGKEGESQSQIPVELVEGTKEKGCVVGWSPQEEVLVHPAVGGFLTHSGWNSTLESLVAGVPMICWPYFADQQINSRFVSEVWKIGVDMKDTCDRSTVEKMVRDLMDDRREEFMIRSYEMAEMAKRCVSEGGSSYCNLEELIQDIKSNSLRSP